MTLPKIPVALVLAVVLGACQQSASPQDNGGANNMAPPPSATAGPTLWNSGEAKPLDTQVAHPNGTVLQLTSLQSRPTATAVGIRVINGRDKDVDLNRFNSNRDGYLLLDSGERLYLSPPATNTRLNIPAGQTFEGELVFLGRLPSTRSAVLVLNENSSGDNQHTTTPRFRIDLPLSGALTGAAQ